MIVADTAIAVTVDALSDDSDLCLSRGISLTNGYDAVA